MHSMFGMSSSFSGRGWYQFGTVVRNIAIEDLEEHGKYGKFCHVIVRATQVCQTFPLH